MNMKRNTFIWGFTCILNFHLLQGLEVLPEFAEEIGNKTIPVGQDVSFTCVVENLGDYRVGWFQVEKQQVLAIHTTLITRNYRVTLSHSDDRRWTIRIKNVKEEDRGQYMCQINSIPMRSQSGFLDVVVPPDIIDDETSSEVVAQEGANVSLRCRAAGYPEPSIMWRREDGALIPMGKRRNKNILLDEFEGEDLNITRVSRLHMGSYLCMASNGVKPSVSRRIMLQVNFPPMLWIPHQLIGIPVGSQVTLECHSEAHPKSINYWKTSDGTMIMSDNNVQTSLIETSYKTHMKLKIQRVTPKDFGSYKCVSKNPMGDTEGTIRLYETPGHDSKAEYSPTKKSLQESKALASRKNRLMDSSSETEVRGNAASGSDGRKLNGITGGNRNGKQQGSTSSSSSLHRNECCLYMLLHLVGLIATIVWTC